VARIRWVVGQDHGLVWSGGIALIEGVVDSGVVERLWGVLEAGGDLPVFLEALRAETGSDFLTLPSFAIAFLGAGRAHVAVRGAFDASASKGDRQVGVQGLDATTWTERQIAGAERVTLERRGDDAESGRLVVAGVLPARLVRWQGVDEADPAVQEPIVPLPEIAAATEDPGDTESTTPEPVATAAVAGDDVANPMGVIASEEDAWDAAQIDDLWENTMAGGIEDAAVRPADQRPPRRTSPPRPSLVEPIAPAPVAQIPDPPNLGMAAPKPSELAPAWLSGSRESHFIEAVPRQYPVPPRLGGPARLASGNPAQHPAIVGDHDGETVARASLPLPTSVPIDRQPEGVEAAFCPDRHPNAPQSSICRICGAPVSSITSRIPQPVIGRLVLSTGGAHDLIGTIILGRNPHGDRFQGGSAPRLVSLPFTHISGTHLELRVEAWEVLALDLKSTNGTYLRRGHDPLVRLPESPTTLRRGDILEFGDGLRMAFEELP
jgi:hypothetical protein